MKKHALYLGVVGLAIAVGSCHTPYAMDGISRTRILVDSRFDARPNEQAEAFVRPYSRQVDSLMKPVVGRVARYMACNKPESELSNLLTDILMWTGKKYGEQPDFGVYNMGGIRAALAGGEVDLGDILDVAPFENKVSFLTLTGASVKKLFGQIAARGGEGLSHGVELEITPDGKLLKAMLNGKEVEESRSYRVVTLDYLAQGNDQLTAFKEKTNVNEPKGTDANVRSLIAEFFKEKTAAGVVVDSKIEGRVKVVKQ